jgi:N utilization substance protein B
MQKFNRREERKQTLFLLFETVFRGDETPDYIFSLEKDERELPESEYIKAAYFGTLEHLSEIDAVITSHAKGRTAAQMTNMTRSILRLAVYEILYMPDIPAKISINEAVELSKEFEDEKIKGFINGILNSIYKDSIEEKNN